MSKETENKLVPEVRFPEFKNDGEWGERLLGSLSVILRGGSPRPIEEFLTQKTNGLNWLKIGDVDKDAKYVVHTEEKVIESALSKTRVVNPGDLIMSNSMSFGRPYILKIKTCIHDGWIAITDISNAIDRDYLYYVILSNKSQAYFSKAAAGSGVKNLNADIIKLLSIFYPSKKQEQQKIADCLSSLDELIDAENQKLNALKEHKKGLMQQLFPAQGKTVPELRFPGFSGEWEEKKLGDIGDILMCKRIFAEETNDKEGVPFYKIGTLGGKPDAYISMAQFEEYKSKYNYPRKGEILITCSGTIGKCLVYNGEDAYYQDSNIVWVDNPALEIRNDLLFHILSKVNWGKLNSTTITRIYGADLRSLLIVFPKNKKEQEKVANFLSVADTIINMQAERIKYLKEHKAGLMQQLFPSPK